MPLYFFNLYDHVRDIDNDGIDLAGPDSARIQGVIFAGDYLSDHPELVWDGKPMVVEVRDDAGQILINVTVRAETPA